MSSAATSRFRAWTKSPAISRCRLSPASGAVSLISDALSSMAHIIMNYAGAASAPEGVLQFGVGPGRLGARAVRSYRGRLRPHRARDGLRYRILVSPAGLAAGRARVR